MRSRSLALAALVGVGALLLTSCASSASAGSAAAADVIEIETPTGVTIEMPAEPQSALGFYTTDVDILITLGFTLAPEQPVRDDFSTFPDFFPQEELEGIKGFGNYPEFNLEKILEVGPDFILNGLGYETDLDADLQKIAPTYTYNAFDGADWRDSFEQLASDLGRTAQYEAWTEEYEARVADIRARLDEKGIDPVVADLSFWDGQVQGGCYGVPCLVFADLGLQVDPVMNSDENGLPASDEYAALSMEQLAELSNIDVVFSGVDEDGTGIVGEDATLASNALWTQLPFVQSGNIHGYNYEMSYGSPSGQMAYLAIVEKALLG